jgi:glycosyltransferase involved in cell wall biosynthesis
MTPSVLINARFLSQRLTGVQRYAHETLHALDALVASGEAPVHLVPIAVAPEDARAPELRAIRFERCGPFSGHLWEQTTLFARSRGHLLVSFGPTGPLFKRRQVVTIHDAAVDVVPDTFGRAFRSWYKFLLSRLARRTPAVMTVSDFSRGEIVRSFGARSEAVHVSGEGFEHVFRVPADASVLARHGLEAERYVLLVGSLAPHKNLAIVAEALARLPDYPLPIVVAGGVAPGIFGQLPRDSLRALRLIGYVEDAELRALYENASVFVFPSRYEGFGLPPLEALALGCPVIAARAGAVPEVCGDAVSYFGPDDAGELARLLRQVAENPDARGRWVERGRARLARHGWRGSARKHLELWSGALA